MSNNSYISLIDLSKQLPFEIDDKLKEELCFGETLIISCGHYVGDIGEGSSESDWTCHESTDSEASEKVLEPPVIQKLPEVEESSPAEEDQDNEFHFFFFPDCTKTPPEQNSQASFIMVDGLPQLNPGKKMPDICTCHTDARGECECHTKLPCRCGAKTKPECTCAKLKDICICGDLPQPVCKCKSSDVCVCADDGKIKPICTCDQVDKPCICHPGKFPKPVCECTSKPKFYNDSEFSEPSFLDLEEEPEKPINVEPCVCQLPDPKPRCFCLKGKDCICKDNQCVCEAQKPCVCESAESVQPPCKDVETKSICDCVEPIKECTCEAESPDDCKCLPKLCTCGDPQNCKCAKICDCSDPCLCETAQQKDECVCLDKTPPCTCHDSPESKKLKKVRAGKHGYRWCHVVDPHHTYFDFAYGRHDKISYKEQERERFKVLGLYDEKLDDKVSDTEEIKAPPFVKKVRKPSIDCCSSVGGISFSVETLGEDKDKFLVQVVSHASKEGAKTGSKLVSILDCNLHTMEENRTEHITKGTLTKERRSYMAICESGYYNKVTRICGDKDVVKRLYHSFEKAHNFLLEGANIVFLRYIGLRRYRGKVQTDTVLMDGTICQSVYVSQGVSQAIVNGKPLFVVKVERHIIEPSGVCHQTLTVLTLRGYIVSHEWADSSYLFHINPLLNVIPEKDIIEEHSPLRERWREDLQLLSDYLDYKSTRSSEGARYVMESGALTGAVRDYLQAILLLRPQDTLHFTRHYFGSVLSALDIPHDEYFDPTSKHVSYSRETIFVCRWLKRLHMVLFLADCIKGDYLIAGASLEQTSETEKH